jgi:Sel1 repeat
MSMLLVLSGAMLLVDSSSLLESNPPVNQFGWGVGCVLSTFECAVDMLEHDKTDHGVGAMRSAANMGDVRAQRALGLMYVRGEYVPRNQRQAIHWFRTAANRGDRESMTILGTLYERGIGTKVDLQQAALWRDRAAR